MNQKLTEEENLESILKDKIEKVLFNTDDLNTLKVLIHKVSIGAEPAKTLREAIINFRDKVSNKLLKKLTRIIRFYVHQISIQGQISEFSSENNSSLRVDLQEKNEFLKNIASRVNILYDLVKKKLNISA